MAFQIVYEEHKTNHKYKLARKSVCFKLGKINCNVENPEAWIKSGIKDIVAYVAKDVQPNDRVGFTFGSECFSKGDAHLSFRKAANISFEEVWDLLGKIYQSNSEGLHSDTFRMTMTQVSPYRGAGRINNYSTYEEECTARRGIISVGYSDSLCLVRALTIAIAYAIKSPFALQIKDNTKKIQDIETYKLMQDSGVRIPEDGATMEEVRAFQTYLTDFKITVYAYGSKGRTVLFEGPDAPKKLNLLHHNDHFNVITNLKAAFSCRYYCENCHVPFNNKYDHRCSASCPCCRQVPRCEKTNHEITCDDCNRDFRGLKCYNKHKVSRSCGKMTVCQYVQRCADCLWTVQAGRQHICGEMYCKICQKHQPTGHYCYIRPDYRKPRTQNILFIFYDLETRQDLRGMNGEKIHVPTLCVFQQRCDVCLDADNTHTICSKCCVRRQILRKDPIDAFLNYILGVRNAFSKIVVIAHNGKAFDHQFLLKRVLESTDLKVDLIMKGTSVIMMALDNVKIIDSINYFPMALADLPQAFDLGPELKKGYFPHLFNVLENANYDGLQPALKFFNPDRMGEEARMELMKWHKEHENDNFNMQRDLVEYCISDVDILTKACLKFRNMFLRECNVCPFTEAVTIASACNLVYRRNFLKPQTIGIIPRNGYRNVDNQSRIATLWLINEELQRGIEIIHSAKRREVDVEGTKVDGYCEEKRLVFQFHGCYFHGHTCISSQRNVPMHDDPMDTLDSRLERTQKRSDRLRQRGYEVIEMWECEFRQTLQKNKLLKMELENNPLMSGTPLDPRDAFFGGRTGNTCTYYQVKPGEKIKYVDVCSLYPWVCKYGKFPVGHPRVFVGEECNSLNLSTTDGLIKCKILPSQDLFHPVLPQKMNNRLMFVLCRTCGENLQEKECDHNENERALVGTWVIDEVKKALEKGYKIMEMYEIWKYEIELYDPLQKDGGLFTEMMNKFIMMKQHASGWPNDCNAQNQKKAYIQDFFNKEGVQLEYSAILKNPGLRSLAKLMLNSFWGKYGQRENQPNTAVVRQPHELDELLSNPAIDVKHIEVVNENTLVVSWAHLDEAADLLATVNVCIAAYTTTQARLELYSYLERLGDRVLYYDTDSVIYVSKSNEWDIPTGSGIGEMTDELTEFGCGSYIVAFASGGPKNYSYVIFSPMYHTYFTVCKVKGIRLDYNALKLVNFYSMSQMVQAKDPEEPLYITCMNIGRTKNHQVITKEETKLYRPKSEKRKFDGSLQSVPYGYKRLCILE